MLLDVFSCNAIGIWLGLQLCTFLGMKKYPQWIGVSRIPTTTGKIKRIIQQFTPKNWKMYEWNVFQSPTKFFYFGMVVIFISINECNAFFLKYLLWVPPTSPLNVYRLLIWFLIGVPAAREFYVFFDDEDKSRIGFNAWISAGVLITELLVVIKYARGVFVWTFPPHIWVNWGLFAGLLGLWFVLFFFVLRGWRERVRGVRWALNWLLGVAFVPFVVMFVVGCPELVSENSWLGKKTFDNFVNELIRKYFSKVN